MRTIARFSWSPMCIIFALGLVGHQFLFHGSYTYDRDGLDFAETLTLEVAALAIVYVGLALLPWLRSNATIVPALLRVGALGHAVLCLYAAVAFALLGIQHRPMLLQAVNIIGFCVMAAVSAFTFFHAWRRSRASLNQQPKPRTDNRNVAKGVTRAPSGGVWRAILVSTLTTVLTLSFVLSVYAWRLLRTEMSYHVRDVTPHALAEAAGDRWSSTLRSLGVPASAKIEVYPGEPPNDGGWYGFVRYPDQCNDIGCKAEAIYVKNGAPEMRLTMVSRGLVLQFTKGSMCVSTNLGFDLYSNETGELGFHMSVREGMDCMQNPIRGVLGWLM